MIKGYCRDWPGFCLVNQGDYRVISVEDNEAISPSEFPKAVEPGIQFEMSIVIRQKKANRTRCPRCRHVDLCLAENRGWIEW